MANPIEYIVFEPDQVLTNDHLNETFNYLDQQNRWTRNKLIGIGIVCGLDIVLNPGVIQINKGTGITSQGYLISQDTTEYTYYIPYSPVDMPQDLPFTYTGNLPFYKPYCQNLTLYMLLSDDQYNALESAHQSTAVTISSATSTLANYAVVLFLEAAETELKNCNMLDCNNSGSTMAFTLRPLLVATKDLPGAVTKPLVISWASLHLNLGLSNQVSLKRYNVPYAALNNATDVINGFVNLVDDATLTQVAKAYTACYQQYGSLVGATANPFTNLLANLQSARSSIQSQNPVFAQYLYDFVDDLIKAYYEFTAKASEIMGTCCPDENLFPLHLVLGSASQATSAYTTDPYRTYFIYSALFTKMGNNDVADAALLFNRMVIIVNYFTVQSQALQLQAAITITPSNYEYPPLSERAIPYYYKVNVSGSELYKYWNYYKTTQGQATSNLSYNASLYSSDAVVVTPLLYDIEPFNFFRVEGHIGQNYNTVLTNIVGQQSKYNLPFDVVAISADQLQSTAPLPACNMNDLDTDYQLLVSEAACKIHTVFCFVTKLPYVVAAPAATTAATGTTFTTARDFLYEIPKTTTLNYTAFKLAPATIDILATLKSTAYKKGDFLQKYCPPVANTIGSAYLSALSSTGVFTNPVQIDSSNALTTVYYYLFAFVDAVEALMYVLNTNTLDQLDITSFNTVYQTYLTETLAAMGILMDLTEQIAAGANTGANAQYVTLAEDTELALLVEELGLLTNMCLEERLQVLNNNYTTRLTNYQQQLTFLNYYKNHTGLEHKAGVPKGGTFVLVYHTATSTTTTNANAANNIDTVNVIDKANTGDTSTLVMADKRMLVTDKANTDVLMTDANTTDTLATNTSATETSALSTSTINYIGSYINESTLLSAAERENILNILNKIPIRKPAGYTLTDGAVIADFYIPYLCCSDCPPVAYILTTTTAPPPAKPVITMGTTFCDSDTTAEPITVSAPGGTFNTVAGLDPTKLTFTPATAKAGTYAITYTLNDVASDPVTVVVLATPVSTFTFTSKVSTVSGITTVKAAFTPDQANSAYTYQWSFGAGFSATTSAVQSPELTAQVSPSVGPIATTATLTVSNGKCAQAAVTKKLYITVDGVTETAPVKPTITMAATSFCDTDTTAEPIKVSAQGGTFNTVAGLDPTKLTFTPATAKAGTFTITYTLDGVASDPVTVTVLATPASTFTFTSKVNNINGVTTITADFIPDQKNTAYTYKWSFGTGFSAATSAVESPELTAILNPTGAETETFATLTVSNGKCAQAAVTKKLFITGNGLSENPPGTPPTTPTPTKPLVPTGTNPILTPVTKPESPVINQEAAPAVKPTTDTATKAEVAPTVVQAAKPDVAPIATEVVKPQTTAAAPAETGQVVKAEAAPATQAEAAPILAQAAKPATTATAASVAKPVTTTAATAETGQVIKPEAAPATQAEAAPVLAQAVKPATAATVASVAKPATTPAATAETAPTAKPVTPAETEVAKPTATAAPTAKPATTIETAPAAKPATTAAAAPTAKPATATTTPAAKPVTPAETAAAKPATTATAAKPVTPVETAAAKPATTAAAAPTIKPAATPAAKPTAAPAETAAAKPETAATEPTAKPAAEPETPPAASSGSIVSGIKNLFNKKS